MQDQRILGVVWRWSTLFKVLSVFCISLIIEVCYLFRDEAESCEYKLINDSCSRPSIAISILSFTNHLPQFNCAFVKFILFLYVN
ncbi:hypothetical protein BCR32DRAFT_287190 [Anaeromyces robustus]|uniref:Uncharacterized protein n=1 Tax=Anaeromyces robustus TaxID=1754192 RepID=A0A1Y1VSL1_9FUNG|nr:hypothetical protein BCR32DRAFT_287190 [Anaeromyces robustus]|eukprot:ORX64292.1 hypothetical protein BCR32DRAFT_287190 [Anaeromyces robustus]